MSFNFFIPIALTFSKKATVIRKTRLIFCLFLALSAGSNVFAQESDEGVAGFAVEKLEMQWSPGEQYNGLNGTMNYANTDLFLPGNGKLPIEIVRRFGQRRFSGGFTPLQTFGYMSVDIPSVSYRIKENEGLLCNGSGQADSTSILEAPMTFRHGNTVKQFFGGADNTPFQTPDGWRIKCVPNTGTLGQSSDYLGSLLVQRPDGVEYEMKRAWNGRDLSNALYRVYRMSDPYGNTLTYNYSRILPTNKIQYGIVRLDSIIASDGRRVDISYTRPSVTSSSNNQVYSPYRISSIQSNSSENPVKLTYEYSDNANTITVVENETATSSVSMSRGKILSITYPNGGRVDYSYQDILESAGTKYETLKTRTTSEGGNYIFYYKDNGNDTLTRRIKTPSAWLDQTYGHPRESGANGAITNHVIDSGRLKRFRRYERGTSSIPGNLLLDIDYTFTNLSPSSITNQAQQHVVPKRTTVKMNNGRSVYIRDNQAFDTRGYATQVAESSPGSSTMLTTYYAYRHTNFSRHILGKMWSMSLSGHSETYSYNPQGDIESESINGITTRYQWHKTGDSRGEMSALTLATGHTTSYSNYKRGQAQRIANPSFYYQNRVINDNGTLASETRFTKSLSATATGPSTKFTYDPLRRVKQIDPERIASASVNHQWSNINSLNITDGNNTRYVRSERLDAFGRIISKGTFDRDQNRWSTVKYEYDVEGRLLLESYPINQTPDRIVDNRLLSGTHYRYDALNRITGVTVDENSGNDSVMTYGYGSDDNGNLTITEMDGRGSKTTTTYRSYGTPHYSWPMKIVDANGQTSLLDRETRTGRVRSFTRGGQTTRYTYNSQKLLASMSQSENGTTFFEYHPDGQLASRSNRGRTVSYEYYSDNSLHRKIFTDLTQDKVTQEFTYDIYNNLESAVTTSANGTQNNTLTYTYDNDNNVTSQTLSIDGQAFLVSYWYDELSNVSGIQYPNNRKYIFSPNSLGKATSIKEIGGQRKTIYDSISYNDNQSMKLMRRTGHEVENVLNDGQRPSKFRVKQYGNGRTEALGEREYVYDRAANIASINDTVANRFVLFSYDSRNRLIYENISNADNWSFGYSPNDNIDWVQRGSIRSDYEYDSSTQRLTGVKSDSSHRQYEYDAQGNMTAHERMQDSSKVTRLLTYNAANQLAAMSDGTTYSYDARGLRVKQDRNGAIYTLYDPMERLIFRLDSQTNVSSEYFYVDGKLIARRDYAENQISLPPATPTPATPPPTGSDITVSGRTISWPDDGWYEVQNEDGSINICSGGSSCTVPSAGIYQVINHTTDEKVKIVVGSNSEPESGITVSGRTISWPDDGWYQVQNEDGSINICSGGRSCSVPSGGKYQVINHTTDTKTRVDVQ